MPTAISPSQVRAARALLDWPIEKLAERSGISVRSLIRFENGQVEPRQATLDSIRRALVRAGVEFLPRDNGGPGVRLKRGQR